MRICLLLYDTMDISLFFHIDNDDFLYEFQDFSYLNKLSLLNNSIESFIYINAMHSLNTAEWMLFDIVAISEIWTKDNYNHHAIPKYTLFYIDRAIYVNNQFSCHIL